MAKSLDEIFGPQQGQKKSLDEIFSAPPAAPIVDPAQSVTPNANDTSIGRTVMDQTGQGLTFGLLDEGQDAIGTAMAKLYGAGQYGIGKLIGDNRMKNQGSALLDRDSSEMYGEARQGSQQRLEKQAEERPVLSTAANVGGAILTGGAGATTKTGGALINSLRAGSVPAKVTKNILAGTASGGAYGFGTGEGGFEERLESAGELAPYGAAGAGGLTLLGAGVKKTAPRVMDMIRGPVNKELSKTARKGTEKVFNRLKADFPEGKDLAGALEDYSKNSKALVQVGKDRTRNLAEGAGVYPSGAARSQEFFREAVGGAPDRLKASASKAISNKTSYYDTLDDIVLKGREKSAPIYKEAFSNNQTMSSKTIDRILETPEGKSALKEAIKNVRNKMSLAAKPDKELTALAKELEGLGKMKGAKGGVAKGLKLETLDEVKKSMDDTINKAFRAGDESEARRIIALKKGLVGEVDKLDKSGLYKQARQSSGDYLSNRDALERGAKFFKEDGELVGRFYKGLGKTEQESYKAGVIKAMRNQIDAKSDGHNVAAIFSKPAVRDKLRSILPEGEYNALLKQAGEVDDVYKLRNQVSGNSRTALRQNASQEFETGGRDILNEMMSVGTKRTAINRAADYMSKKFDGLSDNMAREVSEILYESNPQKKEMIVKALENLANKNKAVTAGATPQVNKQLQRQELMKVILGAQAGRK